MNKILKIFVLLLSIFLLNNKVYALDYLNGFYLNDALEINETEIVGSKDSILADSTAGDTYFKLAQMVDDDSYTIAYCSDGDKDVIPVDDKTTMTKNCKEITNNRKSLVYTYENGYNYTKYNQNYSANDYLTGDYLTDYYITQSSVWYYTKPAAWMNNFDLKNSTYNGINNDITKKITKLINEASKAEAGATLNINLSDSKMTLTNDKKYFISSPIKLVGTYLNSNITTSLSGGEGAFVTTDQNATTGNTSFANNSTVYIKVPNNDITNTKISLTIESTTALNEGKIIECNHATIDESQPMIIYAPVSSKLSKSISLSINKYPVKITKKDISNSEELEGATLTIKNSNGATIDTWISSKETKEISLLPGTYTLEETIAPEGYIKNTSRIEFTVNENGKVLVGDKEVEEIIITNEPIIVTISKRSITGSEELAGAKLKITDKDGNVVKDTSGNNLEWTSTAAARKFNLKMGDYILEETIAPEGYELSETTIEFTINGEGKILIDGKEVKDNLIIFENTPEPKQVPTGNTLTYVAGALCLVALGVSIYIIIKRKEL